MTVGHSIDCNVEATSCDLHLTKDGVQDPAGWPITIDGPCPDLRIGWDGRAYVACSPPDGATIHLFGLDGRHIDGWPVRVDGSIASVSWYDFSIGCGIGRSAIEVSADGSAYVAISSGPVASLHVFNPDGHARAGWPQPIPGDPPGPDGHGGDGCRGFTLADDDGVLAWGYEGVELDIELAARRTEFTSWSADGEVRPGWPRGSAGAASGPVLDLDGGVTYVSATGRVWSHDHRGEIRDGWPYQLDKPAPPHVAPDGRIAIVVPVAQARDRLVLFRPDGRLVTGAPIDMPADIESRCLFGDTPCAGVTSPAFAFDGTMYVSLAFSHDGENDPEATRMAGGLVAFDRDGAIVDGWPIDLAPRTHLLDMSVDSGDRLVARGYVCDDGCWGEATRPTTLIFAPDGELIRQTFED